MQVGYYYHFVIKLSKHNIKRRRSGSLLIVTFLDACLVQQWWGAARAAGASSWPGQRQAQELAHAQKFRIKERTMDNARTETLNAVKMH